MKTSLSRRTFLKSTLVAAAAPLAAAASPAAPPAPALPAFSPTADPAGLTGYQVGPQIWVRWNNQLITSYRAHTSQKYPYLFPVTGPISGLSLTSETALPWPHHRSLFFGCDRVNGGDYWAGETSKHQILSTGLKLTAVGKESAEIVDACEWRNSGKPIMKDQRRIAVRIAGPGLRFIDWEIEWAALEDIAVQKTNHSLFSLRAAGDITPSGGGQLVNAEGESGEKATFGKKSAWCDFSGKRAGVPGDLVEGIAMMDHPKNPWSPCPWFTRDYGFISPTPLNWIEKPWELAAGKSVRLRYRVVLHAGHAKDAGLDAIYREWIA